MDTSAFVAGFDPFSISEEQITVPLVKDEMKSNSLSWTRFKTAVESGKLKIKAPAEESLSTVKASAKAVGDAFFLSEADLQVLALALELKDSGCYPLIVTDDYSMQNVATQINVEFTSFATFGIRRPLKWVRYCPACHKKYPADYRSQRCKTCGTELKRKPRREGLKRRDKVKNVI